MPSFNVEDYIKNIYELSEVYDKVSPSMLAGKLDITPASVTGMIKKLSRLKFVHYKRYGDIVLTEKGKILALKIIRRHRLWEMFLFKVLKFSWDEIHGEAEKLEHVMSDKLEEKVDRILGFPKFDPHGHPIPSKEGLVSRLENVEPLSSLEENDKGVIVRVNDEDKSFLHYMSQMNIHLNQKVVIREKRSFDGSLLLSVKGEEHSLSKKAADNLYVQRIIGKKESHS